MPSDSLTDTLTEKFLNAARTASWFNETFDYRTVSMWCEISEIQGRNLLDKLIELGLVEEEPGGTARLTDTGRLQTRRVA